MHYIRNTFYILVISGAEFVSAKFRKKCGYNLQVCCKYNAKCSTYFIVVVAALKLKVKISQNMLNILHCRALVFHSLHTNI